MTVRFRPANREDASSVADVYLASRKTCVAFAPLAHTDDDVRRWIADVLIPTGGVTVAEINAEIVGMMGVSRDDAAGWIDHLYLHPSATDQGIGSRFVEQAKAAIGGPLRLYTFQENLGARRFYERHGFVAIGFGDGSENEERCPDVLYEWTAGPEQNEP